MIFQRRLLLVIATCLICVTGVIRAADDIRLSVALLPDEREAAGLKALNSDQTAVLDALVRRDIANQRRPKPTKEVAAEKFSDRLTADERKNAGFGVLSAEQIAHLDDYVARLLAPLNTPAGGNWSSSPRDAFSAKSLRRGPEIHGSLTLMYGAGSGGYSERGGAMVVSIEDPSGISLILGYSEVHTKGGYPSHYRDGFYRVGFYRDGLYRDGFYRNGFYRDSSLGLGISPRRY